MRHGGRTYSTAINKRAVEGRVELTREGVVGDVQADKKHHGGESMAVCCYALEHYAEVGEFLGTELEVPAFGENLTLEGLLETELCIGDRFRVGEVVIEVTKPREPCATLARKHDNPGLGKWIFKTKYTGFYGRVVETGWIGVEDEVERLPYVYDEPRYTIAEAVAVLYEKGPRDDAVEIANHPAVCKRWGVIQKLIRT